MEVQCLAHCSKLVAIIAIVRLSMMKKEARLLGAERAGLAAKLTCAGAVLVGK
jgi:hypothetical protein